MNFDRILFFASPLLALALHGTGESTVIDPSTGLPAWPLVRIDPSDVILPEGSAIEVLWDASHGVFNAYEPSGLFSNLTAQLAADGFNVTTTYSGLGNIDLSPYTVIVLCVGSAWDSPYTRSEGELLVQFVQSGGGLLILADNSATPANLKAVTRAFSAYGNRGQLQPSDLTFTNFDSHPIFNGVQSIYYRAGGAVGGNPPATESAWTNLGDPVVVTVTGSRVVLLGDINVFDNTYKVNADNSLFATKVFRYLAGL